MVTCQEGIEVKEWHEGHCPQCPSQACHQNEDFVCGSNNVTYRNECILKKIACEQKLDIVVRGRGECPSPSSNEDDKKVSKQGEQDMTGDDKCKIACPRHLSPVCGSNGQTYGNECTLKVAHCEDNSIIKVRSGRCDDEPEVKMELSDQEQPKGMSCQLVCPLFKMRISFSA